MVQRLPAKVTLNSLFRVISNELGFSDAEIDRYSENIFELLEMWEENGYVEIYVENDDREIGRLKDSNSIQGSSPWYINLFHARISSHNDPLIVLRQDGQNGNEFSFSIRFLITHDQMFGTKNEKHNPDVMRNLRKAIDLLIQKGTDNE